MTSQITFYLSRIIGSKVYDTQNTLLGKLADLIIELNPQRSEGIDSIRPKVIGLKIKIKGKINFIFSAKIDVGYEKDTYKIFCSEPYDLSPDVVVRNLLLNAHVLDQQIVDINGRKLVRVNDIRLVFLNTTIYAIAVDVGIEGLLRRIGIDKPIGILFKLFSSSIPSKFILWDEVETIDHSNLNIVLSKSLTKLHTLHPSDLADIIEDMGKHTRTSVFSSLDEEKAADVLEELETHAQVHIIESLPLEKAADVLEKMPADEVADLLYKLDVKKAESLLNEMEKESSKEVRELLQYSNKEVGSLMTTEFLSFKENMTVGDTLKQLRMQKPEQDTLYHLFVTDNNERLLATLSLRDLVVTEPEIKLSKIMKKNVISVYDEDNIDSLAEIISKYNLLAIPVINQEKKLEGMVVIDDIIEDLLDKRKTK